MVAKKYNIDLSRLSEVEIYDLVLSKKIRRFPRDFWSDKDALLYCPKITRYLFDDILKWNSEEIKQKLRKETFHQNALGGMLNIVYHSSPYEAISAAYPERNYKPWDFVNAPNNYWQGDEGKIHGYEAMKWLIEEKLQWTYDDIRKKLNHKIFKENNLLGMFKMVYNSSLFEAVNALYPGVFRRWELGDHVVNDYWTLSEGIEAVRWLIEVKLKWSDADIKEKLSKEIFIKNGLYGMIQRCFNSSPAEAILVAYPDKFKAWELPYVPMNYWNFQNACSATKWLLEEKLKWSEDDIKKKLNNRVFKNNGLVSIIDKFKIFDLIDAIYPGKFKPWEFSTLPNGFWTEEMSVTATRWLIDKLGWNKEYAMSHLRKKHFLENGLSGIFKKNKQKSQLVIKELIKLSFEEQA